MIPIVCLVGMVAGLKGLETGNGWQLAVFALCLFIAMRDSVKP